MRNKNRNRLDARTIQRSVRAFFKTDFGIALLITLAWQLILTAMGYIIDLSTVNSNASLLGHTSRWDAGWYLNIINSAYIDTSPAAPAFYPLYPVLVQFIHFLFFGSIGLLASSFILNTIAIWLAITALVKIIRIFVKSTNIPWLIVALLLASPAAFFMHMFYGEAVFLALGFWSYLFALQRKWKYTALLLMFALTARLPAVTFIALCGLEYLRAHRWNIKKAVFNKTTLWFLLVPIGLISYSLYLHFATGDFLAMSHAYTATDDWTYYKFTPNILSTLFDSASGLYHNYINNGIRAHDIVNLMLPLSSLAILLAASLYALFRIKGQGIPLGIFGIISFVMFTINGHIVSVHRYILPCIVIYIVAAVIIEKHKGAVALLYPVLYASVLIQALIMFFFIQHIFAG